jgi:hypothetical protein
METTLYRREHLYRRQHRIPFVDFLLWRRPFARPKTRHEWTNPPRNKCSECEFKYRQSCLQPLRESKKHLNPAIQGLKSANHWPPSNGVWSSQGHLGNWFAKQHQSHQIVAHFAQWIVERENNNTLYCAYVRARYFIYHISIRNDKTRCLNVRHFSNLYRGFIMFIYILFVLIKCMVSCKLFLKPIHPRRVLVPTWTSNKPPDARSFWRLPQIQW